MSSKLPKNSSKDRFWLHSFEYTTILVAGLLCSNVLAYAQDDSLVRNKPEEEYKIAVPVDLVVLPVTVLDLKGHFVADLTEKNFRVYEDGKLQSIQLFLHEDLPVTVGLVLDNSGSMRPRLDEVNAAALKFAESSNPQDEMFVVKFNEKVFMGLPKEVPFTHSEEQLKAALLRNTARGRTALYDAIITALQHLAKGTLSKRVLLVVSDGGDNSSKHDFPQVLELSKESNAVIYAIGLYDSTDPESNPRVLRRLARLTGGEAFLPNDVEKVKSICQHIAKTVRDQYTLGYIPSNGDHDGAFRTVRVVVDFPRHGKLTVLTRTGYYAPGDRSSSLLGE
ncbi:MAG TPA: VWA domain-containing protein [Terriglobia bacterium]|nr:VWA domain-containing protein [Terriglobia bacterium]